MSKSIYTTVSDASGHEWRLGATIDPVGDYVHVWVVNGWQLGRYKIDRFDGKLTVKTLRKVFMGSRA